MIDTEIDNVISAITQIGASYNALVSEGMTSKQIYEWTMSEVGKRFGTDAAVQVKALLLQHAVVHTSPPMRAQIDRLIDTESPQLADADGNPVENQSPAIECLVMFPTGQAIRGALSRTTVGTLRMMSPGTEGNRPVLVEQFFSYEAVTAITLIRQISAKPGQIIVPSGSLIA